MYFSFVIMILEQQKILLGKGIFDIRFGMNQKQIELLIGEANEEKEYSLAPHENSINLFYSNLGLSFTFESSDAYRLSYISIHDDRYHLFQFIRVGLHKSMLLDELEHYGLSQPEIQHPANDDFPSHELFYFPEENLHLWMDDHIISEIQFGPFWKDHKSIIWEE